MSGSTRVEGVGRYWRTTLQTPCISFASPRPGEESYEVRYHAEAQARFQRAIEAISGPLDALLQALAPEYGLLPLGEGGSALALPGSSPRGPRWQEGEDITVEIAHPLPFEQRERLSWHVVRLLDRISRPEPRIDGNAVCLVRFADGTIEDTSSPGPGFPIPEEMPTNAREEVLARCAEILALAERIGLVHTDLGPHRVRFDEGGVVAIDGFGVTHHEATIEGAPRDFYQAPGEQAPDWIAVGRRGLARIVHAWSPDPARLAATPASGALERWLEESWVLGVPLPPLSRRGSTQIEARIAAGLRGVLVPCRICAIPTLLGAVSVRYEGARLVPLCRPCAARLERRERLLGRAIVAALAILCLVVLSCAIFFALRAGGV